MNTNNEISETEIRGKIPFLIATRKIKYLGINLTKELKDLVHRRLHNSEEIKEDTNKWKYILPSWIDRINIIKMSKLAKATYRLNIIPVKIPMTYFTDIEQTLQKFTWNHIQP